MYFICRSSILIIVQFLLMLPLNAQPSSTTPSMDPTKNPNISKVQTESIEQRLVKATHINWDRELREDISNLLFNSSKVGNLNLLPDGTQELQIYTNTTINTPVLVNISIYIQNIDDFDDNKMDFSVRFIFRQSWIDNRLIYGERRAFNTTETKYILLENDEIGKIWTPDVYFQNEKEGKLHERLKSNTYTRVYPNGLVLQSFKLSVQLKCRVDLHDFPMDIQNCSIRMASYGWLKDEVLLQWEHADVRTRDLKMPYFRLANYREGSRNISRTWTGEYSLIVFYMTFKRKRALYFIQLYIPSALIVFVSWSTFWVPIEEVDTRFAIGVGTMLCLVAQSYVATKDSPLTSYIKASDWWIGFSLFQVFLAFVEYALVNYIHKQENNEFKIISSLVWILECPFKMFGFLWGSLTKGLKYLKRKCRCVCCEDNVWRRCSIFAKNIETEGMEVKEKCLPNNTFGSSCVETGVGDSNETQGERNGDGQIEPRTILRKRKTLGERIDKLSRYYFPIGFLLMNLMYWPVFLSNN